MTAKNVLMVLSTVLVFGFAPSASAEKHEQPDFIKALIGGKPDLFLRFRWEAAKIDGLKGSNAVTLRSDLGYMTGTYHGFSLYAQMENVVAVNDKAYFDGIAPNTKGKTPIADPEATRVTQGFLRWASSGLADDSWFAKSGSVVTGGRQRIVYDNARFIGDVVWRQNQQTYDGGRVDTTFGIEDLKASYVYVSQVNRIFANQGAPGSPTKNFDSQSSFLHMHYSGWGLAKISVFAYLLDFDNSPANSSDSFGFRATGKQDIAGDLFVGYDLSYAYQKDAGNNPTDYHANYYNVEGTLGWKGFAALTLGYEVMTSDDGVAQFRTPLATAHKFNGWADAFLDNGGPNGLRDFYVGLAPQLPWGLKGRLIYHKFESDVAGLDYGYEIDGVMTRKLWKNVTLLGKFAYYDGTSDGRADRYRVWMETSIKF